MQLFLELFGVLVKSFEPQEMIQALNRVLKIDQTASGLNYLKIIVKNIARTFDVRYVLVGHAVKPGNASVMTDVVWAGNDYAENFSYALKGTPCENVYSGERVCAYPSRVAGQFPEDRLLVEMGVESYIGAPLLAEDGDLTGILVLLDDKPVPDVDFYRAVIEFLSMRVGAELSRHYIEERLRRLVEERTMELEESNKKLQQALSEIKTLQGIIPICAKCKKIRDDQGFWQQVESYVSRHSGAVFSHSICPACLEEYYHELKTVNK